MGNLLSCFVLWHFCVYSSKLPDLYSMMLLYKHSKVTTAPSAKSLIPPQTPRYFLGIFSSNTYYFKSIHVKVGYMFMQLSFCEIKC